MVGIEALKDRMIHTLSDGERQKVMIAKALAQQTPVIYLDEPTAFLDFPSKVDMMQLLHRLAVDEQKTIFLSTHDVQLALQLADRLWLMDEQGLHVGTPQELTASGTLNHFVERKGITLDNRTLTIHVTR
jgi:iron complex transport system ATP-binding protein